MTVCLPDLVKPSHPTRSSYSSAEGINQLLVIDRHPDILLEQLPEAFMAEGNRVETACTGATALQSILHDPPQLILLDTQLSDYNGLELHKQIRQIDPRIPVIFVSASRSAADAIEAMKQGAYDFLSRPLQEGDFQRVLLQALQVAQQSRGGAVSPVAPQLMEVDGALCGRTEIMREVYKSIGRVAPQNVNVLITGESGTGKELVARALWAHSLRADRPFMALNCAAIPEALLESELFGHEKGAFTGADRRRIGKFEQCSGGTLLLDEIGDMPLALQAKMLRVIQEQAFQRVGGSETVRTDVRILAATHRDLKALAREEKFRADLYYRLSVFTIHLPPLRERSEDLPMLVGQYLWRFSRELGREIRDIAPQAMECLKRYSWPGNIRELQSVLKQALLQSHGSILLPSFLPEFSTRRAENVQPASVNLDLASLIRERLKPDSRDLYTEAHAQLDRFLLTCVLEYTGGSQHKAARLLGLARQTLRLKLRDLGLRVTQSVEADDEQEP